MAMKPFRFILISLVIFGSGYAWAKSAGSKPRSDQEVRTIIRKKAPFWLQDGEVEVRLNKDGSFATDRAGGVMSAEGKWRVEKSELKLVWTSSKLEKAFPVEIIGRLPVINGVSMKNGRYNLTPEKSE